MINQPLKQILQRFKTSGRLLKWSIELGKFHNEYWPRMAIKAYALADFIAEFNYSEEDDTPNPNVELAKEGKVEEKDGERTR